MTELTPVETENPGGGYGKVRRRGPLLVCCSCSWLLASVVCRRSDWQCLAQCCLACASAACIRLGCASHVPYCRNSALPLSLPLGWLQVVSHVVIGLKTVKGTKQLKLDPTIYDSLQASLCVCF